ncbi:hypothetical protein ACW73L_04445 [Methylolobus aquaticus]
MTSRGYLDKPGSCASMVTRAEGLIVCIEIERVRSPWLAHSVLFFLKLTVFGQEIFGEIVVQPIRLGFSAHCAIYSYVKVQGTESRSPMVNYGALAPSLTLDRRFDPSAFDT